MENSTELIIIIIIIINKNNNNNNKKVMLLKISIEYFFNYNYHRNTGVEG